MPKYQIRFCDSKGNGSFCYVDGNKDNGIEVMAATKATEYINNRPTRAFHNPDKPKRIVHVWEWDSENGEPKKKGYRFKLELYWNKFTFGNGRVEKDYWYEPVINS